MLRPSDAQRTRAGRDKRAHANAKGEDVNSIEGILLPQGTKKRREEVRTYASYLLQGIFTERGSETQWSDLLVDPRRNDMLSKAKGECISEERQ